MTPLRVFIGYDEVETGAYNVLCHSIWRRASRPVSIMPISLRQLGGAMWRYREPIQSNEFTFSRWLVPWLCDYRGWALFIDCDMMLRADIAELFAVADARYAVMCVKHDYEPSTEGKYLGSRQSRYERKNWASVMLFNCGRCAELTPEYINDPKTTKFDLHQFRWLSSARREHDELSSDAQVGELPRGWNHLVGEYDPNPRAKLVHWTLGGPYFEETKDVEFADEWRAERDTLMHVRQASEIAEWSYQAAE